MHMEWGRAIDYHQNANACTGSGKDTTTCKNMVHV